MFIELVESYFKELLTLSGEMAPYLLIGFLFASILKYFFPQRLINKYVGASDFRSALNGSILGIPLPLCSCGVLPTGIGLYRSGASKGASVSFLVSTPQTGVDSIIATYAMLGLPMAIIRPIVALFSGVFGGVLVNKFEKSSPERGKQPIDAEKKSPRSLRSMFHYGFVEMVQDIAKWLIIGLMLAALLAVLIPDDFFTTKVSNEYLSMILVLLASVPLYVCATGSIPIAVVLLMKGLSPGAALVFLMAGPATNLAAMTVISNSLGKRTFGLYLISILLGALISGIIINEFIPRDWILNAIPIMEHSGHDMGLNVFKISSVVILGALIIYSFLEKYFLKRKNSVTENNKQVVMKKYIVEGMTCNHCKAAVEREIQKLDPEGKVNAEPSSNELTVSSENISLDQIKKSVEALGYQFGGQK